MGLARVSHETNCRSPLPTRLEDFQRSHLVVGAALGRAVSPGGDEVPHLLRRAELAGAAEVARRAGDVDVVPLCSAWTPPGGPLTAATWAALRGLLGAALDEAGSLDGLVLVLHGALGVEGASTPEADLLASLRAQRPHLRVVVVLDLHAHITPALVGALDLVVAYRTNPHRDHLDTGRRAMRLLLAALRGEVQPTRTWRSLPMVLGGGTTVDLAPGMWPVFRALRRWARRSGVLDVSVFICHPWVGDPSPCWAVMATTDGDPDLADAAADALAEVVWSRRHVPTPRPLDAGDAIRRVARASWRRRLGCAVLVDTSDVVGAGAPGDHTGLLRALLATAPALRAWVPLRDPDAVAALWDVAEGERVERSVGGRWSAGQAVAVVGRVGRRRTAPGVGRTVAFDLGGPALVLTEGPPLSIRPDFFDDAGLPVREADLVVVKSLLLWLPHFLTTASMRLLVRTQGPTDFDAILDGPFAHPVHPVDVIADWRPHDQAVRERDAAGGT